jgi:hypothetical protein
MGSNFNKVSTDWMQGKGRYGMKHSESVRGGGELRNHLLQTLLYAQEK